MRTALRVTVGMDDSQSVELRDLGGMAVTVLTRQQFEAPRDDARTQKSHFVGWVERSDVNQWLPETMMGFAALYPSYEVCDFCLRRHRLRNPALLPR